MCTGVEKWLFTWQETKLHFDLIRAFLTAQCTTKSINRATFLRKTYCTAGYESFLSDSLVYQKLNNGMRLHDCITTMTGVAVANIPSTHLPVINLIFNTVHSYVYRSFCRTTWSDQSGLDWNHSPLQLYQGGLRFHSIYYVTILSSIDVLQAAWIYTDLLLHTLLAWPITHTPSNPVRDVKLLIFLHLSAIIRPLRNCGASIPTKELTGNVRIFWAWTAGRRHAAQIPGSNWSSNARPSMLCSNWGVLSIGSLAWTPNIRKWEEYPVPDDTRAFIANRTLGNARNQPLNDGLVLREGE
jgi:hypothetical protein